MAILLYEGERFDCILSDHAAEQVSMSSEDDDFPETLFGHDTDELIQRIVRYCDNPGDLVFEIEYNCEGYPWFAIKTQRPSSFRAYFRHFDANERQMVITHFAKKEQQKLKDSDKQQMYESYDEYARNGGY
ncbi:hypothetical protein [Neisseria sp. P0003.S004]|uniref:hypothetical protein n=2 Tax=unclassified Neisseria TaxID=2623750 RepID=UPI00206150DE|nr:MAG TPA: hypothetical protein [Caudoviricetes sp.]